MQQMPTRRGSKDPTPTDQYHARRHVRNLPRRTVLQRAIRWQVPEGQVAGSGDDRQVAAIVWLARASLARRAISASAVDCPQDRVEKCSEDTRMRVR
jgi:hypothetical protein